MKKVIAAQSSCQLVLMLLLPLVTSFAPPIIRRAATPPRRMKEFVSFSELPKPWSFQLPFPTKAPPKEGSAAQAVRRYFDAWNRRDMVAACAVFSDECEYEDTQYAGAFQGKEALEAHLFKVADALPESFQFCVDEVADGGNIVGVQWHVENNGMELPFTRGCSMYRADPVSGLLVSGFDVPEPAPLKPGSTSLALLSVASKIIAEPIRALPAVAWVLYVAIVFFSNGILPGPDATQLDAATWNEVRDLSINFWLISPLLQLPFAPVVHPGLEGIFNLLLAWAAAFSAFASDGRQGRAHGSMVPTLGGMQLLTNAVYLPYLVSRASEEVAVPDDDASSPRVAVTNPSCYREDLTAFERAVGDSPLVGPLLGSVGLTAVAWGFFGRYEDFGGLTARGASLAELLSGDRLGASFVVDLVLFAFFQGWLVDDDLARRGVGRPGSASDRPVLRAAAKYVPFLGLCGYIAFRPPLPSRTAVDIE